MTDNMKYNLFVFLSVLASSLADFYIPIILYNQGFTLTHIFTFFLIKFSFIIITYYFIILLAIKIGFKSLLIISAFFLGLSFYLVSIINNSFFCLIKLALLFSLFLQTYWAGRHYYGIFSLTKKEMSNQIGYMVIATQLALIPSAYLGALIIELWGLKILTIIISGIILISIIPLFFIKEKSNYQPLMVKRTLFNIPKENLLLIGLDQARQLMVIFFPLFIYLKIANNYRYIGIINALIGIASIIFVYFFAKKMDKEHKNHLRLAIILLGTILMFKLNITNLYFMLAIAFFEGLISRMHMTAIMSNIYMLGKDFHLPSYLVIYEITTNLIKVIIILIGILFINNIKVFLFFCLFIFLNSHLIKFKQHNKKKLKD